MFTRSVPEFIPSAEAMEVSIGTFTVVVDAVRRAQAKGHFPDAEPEDIAQVLWAVSHGSVSLEIAGMTGPYPERMPMRAADRLQGHRGRARCHRWRSRVAPDANTRCGGMMTAWKGTTHFRAGS